MQIVSSLLSSVHFLSLQLLLLPHIYMTLLIPFAVLIVAFMLSIMPELLMVKISASMSRNHQRYLFSCISKSLTLVTTLPMRYVTAIFCIFNITYYICRAISLMLGLKSSTGCSSWLGMKAFYLKICFRNLATIYNLAKRIMMSC